MESKSVRRLAVSSSVRLDVGRFITRLRFKNLDLVTPKSGGDAKSGLKLDVEVRLRSLWLLARNGKTENRILVVEPIHSEAVHIVEAQGGKDMVAEDVVSTRIDFRGELPQMDLGSKHRKDVSMRFWLHVATPQTELDDLRVVK